MRSNRAPHDIGARLTEKRVSDNAACALSFGSPGPGKPLSSKALQHRNSLIWISPHAPNRIDAPDDNCSTESETNGALQTSAHIYMRNRRQRRVRGLLECRRVDVCRARRCSAASGNDGAERRHQGGTSVATTRASAWRRLPARSSSPQSWTLEPATLLWA